MARERRKRSLRGQMTFIILLCWLVPMALAAGALGGYLTLGLGRQSRQAIEEQFQLNLQMGADRVESAVEASRLPSYDPELAASLDTAVGFFERDGQVYLVRNLMGRDFRPIGVLALALDLPYYFEDLSLLGWASSVSVELGADTILSVKGGAPPPQGEKTLEHAVTTRDFTLRGMAAVDYAALLAGFGAYRWVLGAMGLSLLLLLLFTFRFFRRRISQPIEALMAGAADIQGGAVGLPDRLRRRQPGV